MSLKHFLLIAQIEGLTHQQAAVLNCLAIHADDEGLSWPGVPLLARETRYSQRWVKSLLHELVDLEIIVKRKGTYETHYRTLYFLAYAETRISTPVEPPPLPPPPATNGTTHARRNDLIGLFSKREQRR